MDASEQKDANFICIESWREKWQLSRDKWEITESNSIKIFWNISNIIFSIVSDATQVKNIRLTM